MVECNIIHSAYISEYSVALEDELTMAYEWFVNNQDKFRG